MTTDVSPSAPLAVLAFLGLLLALVASLVAGAAALAKRSPRWAARAGAAGGAAALAYGALLLGAALTSRERVLAPGEEKHLCEIDCHLAYAVTAVREAALLPGRSPRNGRFLLVDVRVRFDSETTSPRRPKDAPLTPNSRRVALIDAAGRTWPALGEAAGSATLADPVRPGESETVTLAFDLPADARAVHLALGNGDPETRLLIGHENSPGHAKVLFALPPVEAQPPAAVRS